MIIANPLYDVVFKYLLEDMDIAKEFLSAILREEILYVEPKPQETVTEVSADGDIRIIRFDFKVTIETPTGELKKTLILGRAKQFACRIGNAVRSLIIQKSNGAS